MYGETRARKVFKAKTSVLKGLPEGAFPPLELEWLAAAAWNRGCHHERFGREAAAKDFVRATRELLRHGHVNSGRLRV